MRVSNRIRRLLVAGAAAIAALGGAAGARGVEQPTRLVDQYALCNEFSPDGSRLAYRLSDNNGAGELRVQNADGTGDRGLGEIVTDGECPVWSPDGTRLAYASRESTDYEVALDLEVFVVTADGNSPRVNVSDGPSWVDTNVAWSADGQSVLFRTNRFGESDIVAAPADGSGPLVNLTSTPGQWETGPEPSPDGSTIAYTRFASDPDTRYGPAGVWLMDADGGDQRELTVPGIEAARPFWSPDSSRIAFFESPRNSTSATGRLWVMNADGSDPRRLVDTALAGYGIFGGAPDADWAPDSQSLVYATTLELTGVTSTGSDLFTVGVDGTERRKLTTAASQETRPRWAPTGESIVYVSNRDDDQGIDASLYRIPSAAPADATPPVVLFTSPAQGATYVQYQSVPLEYACVDDETGLQACTASSHFVNTFVPGPASVTVTAVNGAGAETVGRIDYTVVADGPPDVTITAPADGATYRVGETVLADYTCADPLSGVQYCLGSLPVGAPVATDEPGTFTFEVFAADNAGNQTSRVATYVVAATEPGELDLPDAGPGTYTTDPAGAGATPETPVQTEITIPAGVSGPLSVTPQTIGDPAPAGYAFLGTRLAITAPPGSVAEPLQLVFRLDSSLVPAEGPDAVLVFRDGVQAADCSGAPGTAVPDPCVSSRESLADGDLRISVLSSHASDWNFGQRTDFTPPVLKVPGNKTVNATGPAGASVTYAASAEDAVDLNPVVTCSPPSGATFPVGKTTVSCSATDHAGNSTTKSFRVTVTAPKVALSAASLAFPDQLVGTTSAARTLTIRNSGNGALVMSRAIVGPNAGDFRLAGGTCAPSLGAGASCSVKVAFRPSSAGNRSAALQITSNAVGSPHRVSLSGRGCRLIVVRALIRICL